jgi:hypothetical protein
VSAPAATVECPTCALEVPDGLTFCPRCRAKGEGRVYDPTEADRHERSYVLSLVVLSLGALAIPRLLRSPAFSRPQKVLLALAGALNTSGVVVVGALFFTRWLPAIIEAAKHHH